MGGVFPARPLSGASPGALFYQSRPGWPGHLIFPSLAGLFFRRLGGGQCPSPTILPRAQVAPASPPICRSKKPAPVARASVFA